jgi:hypothetical protein
MALRQIQFAWHVSINHKLDMWRQHGASPLWTVRRRQVAMSLLPPFKPPVFVAKTESLCRNLLPELNQDLRITINTTVEFIVSIRGLIYMNAMADNLAGFGFAIHN